MASALNGVKTPALPPGPTFDPQVQAAAANVNAAYNSSRPEGAREGRR